MERLYTLILRVAVQASLLFAVLPAAAQEYCSLTVGVLAPNGLRPRVSITVQEKDGRIEDREQVSTDARFCDLGGLPVTVKVGDEGTCNQVIVRDVPVAWQEPYLLRVTYDPEPCLRDLPRPVNPACRVIFRVANPAGDWASKARIVVLGPRQLTLEADSLGRASFIVSPGQTVTGTAKSTGGAGAAKFAFQCDPGEPIYEARISLRTP